jgi:hypothetical protein
MDCASGGTGTALRAMIHHKPAAEAKKSVIKREGGRQRKGRIRVDAAFVVE